MNNNKKFVIALGGSIVMPGKINTILLRRFYLLINKEIKNGNRFIFIIGGGAISREYQRAISKIKKICDEDKDLIGVYATRLNAQLIKSVFKKEANPVLFDERFKIKNFGEYSVIIASGWQPGWSTDYVAVQIAVDFNIRKVIILGKPDYVYTADFEKDKKAKPIEIITWKDYFKLIPSKWKPGLHAPVDPVAARLAKEKNITGIVAKGTDLVNFRKIIEGKNFKGTILTNDLSDF